jgi:hypothetical protein
MGRTPVHGVSRRRKSDINMPLGLSTSRAAGRSWRQRKTNERSSSTGQSHGADKSTRIQTRPQGEPHGVPSLACSSGEKEYGFLHKDQHSGDLMNIWSEPRRQQHKDSWSSTLLENLDSDEIRSPVISALGDVDFSYIDENQFDIIGSPADMIFPPLASCPDPQSSSPQFQQHHPKQQEKPLQLHAPHLLKDSTPTIGTLSCEGSNSSSGGTPIPYRADVNYWTTQLEELSQRACSSPIPLDEMLHYSSQLLPQVGEALRAAPPGELPTSPTHLVLILVCLTQTVALFEQCFSSIISGLAEPGSSSDISVRLGAFQVDREVQQALQVHVVGRELLAMLRVCKLVKQTMHLPDWNGTFERTHSLLLEDLQARTRTLACQVKQSGCQLRGSRFYNLHNAEV